MKTILAKKLSLAGVAAAALIFNMQQAQAAVGQANTWMLEGVTFDDGATASGTFSVDSSGTLTFYNITTTTMGMYSGENYIFTPGTPLSIFNDDNTIDIVGGGSELYIFFGGKSNSNSKNIVMRGSEYDANQANREITAGSISSVSTVPEPETYGMLLTGLGLMGFMSRRRKSV